jgi:hypothetical protein
MFVIYPIDETTVVKFDIPLTLIVVLFIKGIVNVSKKNVVFVEFEVNAEGTDSSVKFETPETFRDVNVPIDVILGCAGVTRDPVSDVRFERPDTLRDVRIPVLVILGCAGVTRDPVSEVRFERPDTLRDVKIPVLVILGWAAVASDPVIAEPEMALDPACTPYMDPDTTREERVPTDVMFGCAGVTRDPVSEVRFERPVTLRDVKIPVLVMLG